MVEFTTNYSVLIGLSVYAVVVGIAAYYQKEIEKWFR